MGRRAGVSVRDHENPAGRGQRQPRAALSQHPYHGRDVPNPGRSGGPADWARRTPAYLMPRRRRISATSASMPGSSAEPPLTRFAGTLAGAAVVGSTAARSPRPADTATALPLVVACAWRPDCFNSFFLARLRPEVSSGMPPEASRIAAARTRRITPDQVLGENANDCAKFTTAEPIRPTSRIEPVR